MIFMLVSCARREVRLPRQAPADFNDGSFEDLQVGWRMLVVTPILKSGGYRIRSLEPSAGNSANLRIGPDFVGYENDYYVVRKNRSGVRVDFRSAEAIKDGKTIWQAKPSVFLFDFPARMGYVRLIYFVRVSGADHNMAIVAAETTQTLANLTSRVQSDPDHGCYDDLHSRCRWVAPGIAVRHEEDNQ